MLKIALLFFFISILEETGYMSRVVFLMDRTLRKFGLGGKSLIPLVSGVACAKTWSQMDKVVYVLNILSLRVV